MSYNLLCTYNLLSKHEQVVMYMQKQCSAEINDSQILSYVHYSSCTETVLHSWDNAPDNPSFTKL